LSNKSIKLICHTIAKALRAKQLHAKQLIFTFRLTIRAKKEIQKFAVTKGQGNSDWTRDETILALDLYFQFDGKIPGSNQEKVIDISRILNELPIHSTELRKDNFINQD
jgi:hypothetical protein